MRKHPIQVLIFFLFLLQWPFSIKAMTGPPRCLDFKQKDGKSTLKHLRDDEKVGEPEVLARLVYAEMLSTGYEKVPSCHSPSQRSAIVKALLWGVVNRVRLAEFSPNFAKRYGQSVWGVIFHPQQFNPAISKKSPFHRHFLCPLGLSSPHPTLERQEIWNQALLAATAILSPHSPPNPFIQTDWERKNNLSLVDHFYYPHSSQATARPPLWVREFKEKGQQVKEVNIDGTLLADDCVWFFRSPTPKPTPST